MTKNIPGNPNIIVQNVPGAASLIAANQVYNVAKPDGLNSAAIYPALYFDQLIKRPEVKYDWAKWNWIGSPVKSNQLLYMRADTPYKSMDDIRKAATAPKCGSTGIASAGYYIPKLLEEVLNTKFDIVSGYVSGQDIDLSGGTRRAPVPGIYDYRLLRPRAVYFLAQTEFHQCTDTNRQPTRCSDQGSADDL